MTKLEGARGLKEREVISLVGAGGKTTLMFALGRELSARRKGVVLTTTTKIRVPAPSPLFTLLLADDAAELKRSVEQNMPRSPSLLVAHRTLDDGKLQGIPPEWVEVLRSMESVSAILIEADGAAGRPLKAPRVGEPVWAADTTLAIPVIGIDALGARFDEEHVFRSKIARQVLNEPEGATVTEEMICRLTAELLKNRPAASRVIPFINKVDLPAGLEKARGLAQALLKNEAIGPDRVVLSHAQSTDIIREIITKDRFRT
jgi:probable selenium-dependent hydroxylase accessory protein YqeC